MPRWIDTFHERTVRKRLREPTTYDDVDQCSAVRETVVKTTSHGRGRGSGRRWTSADDETGEGMRDVCCVVGRNVFALSSLFARRDTTLTELWNRRTRRAKREREQNKRWKRDKRKRRVCACERATVSTCESVPGRPGSFLCTPVVSSYLTCSWNSSDFIYRSSTRLSGARRARTHSYDTTVPPPGRFEYLPNDLSPLPAAPADSHRSAVFICPLYYPHGSVLFLSTGFSFFFTPQSNHSTVSARRLWQIHYYVPLRVHSGHCQHPKPSNRLGSPPSHLRVFYTNTIDRL